MLRNSPVRGGKEISTTFGKAQPNLNQVVAYSLLPLVILPAIITLRIYQRLKVMELFRNHETACTFL
jgi:hypothetical protein